MLKKNLYLLFGGIVSFCIIAKIDGMGLSDALAALGIIAAFGLAGYTIYAVAKRWPGTALRVFFAVTFPLIVIMFGVGAVTLFAVAIKHASLAYDAVTGATLLEAGQHLIVTAFMLLGTGLVTCLGIDLIRMTAR